MTRRIPGYSTIALFLFSLPLPAFTAGTKDDGPIGLGVLIYGWVGFGKSIGWPWLANPLFLFTLFAFFHRQKIWRRIALCTAAAAFGLALSFLLVHEIPGEQTEPMVGVVTRQSGYYIWLLSMTMLLITAILNNREDPTH